MTLELVLKLRSEGNEIFLVLCRSELSACPANPHHNLSFCAKCRLQSNNLVETFLPEDVNLIKLMSGVRSAEEFQSRDFHSQEDFERLTYRRAPLGQLVLSQLVDDFSDLTIPPAVLASRGVELLNRAVDLFDWSVTILQRLQIDEVYVWNGRRCSDGPVLHAANFLGIKKFCYISGATQNRIFIQPNAIHSLTEWRESIKLFCESRSVDDIRKLGSQFFDSQKSDSNPFFKLESVPSAKGKSRMAIFSSTLWENFNLPEFKSLPVDFAKPYDLIERICRDEILLNQFDIAVRWHPNLASAGSYEQAEILRVIENTPSVLHIPPDSGLNSYSLLANSDLAVSTGSTIGVEATFLGKPSILLGTALYSGLNAVYEPESYDEFLDLVTSQIHSKSEDQALMYGAFMAGFGEKLEFVGFDSVTGVFSFENREVFSVFSNSQKLFEFFKTIFQSLFRNKFSQRQVSKDEK
jgi:hypothetical protein